MANTKKCRGWGGWMGRWISRWLGVGLGRFNNSNNKILYSKQLKWYPIL